MKHIAKRFLMCWMSFLGWLYSKGISEPEDIGELLGISAYKARKLQRLEDLPNERTEKMMVKVMKDG